jgi:hypothetical protein
MLTAGTFCFLVITSVVRLECMPHITFDDVPNAKCQVDRPSRRLVGKRNAERKPISASGSYCIVRFGRTARVGRHMCETKVHDTADLARCEAKLVRSVRLGMPGQTALWRGV